MPKFLYGVLETNPIHTEHNRMKDQAVINSGGTQWVVSPGLQFVIISSVLEASVQLPVKQNMGPNALRDHDIFYIDFRTHFQ